MWVAAKLNFCVMLINDDRFFFIVSQGRFLRPFFDLDDDHRKKSVSFFFFLKQFINRDYFSKDVTIKFFEKVIVSFIII